MQMDTNSKAIKNTLISLISLDKPKSRVILFSIILLTLLVIPISFLESMPNLSFCSHIFGKYCPSIGITRGVSSLLKGNIQQARDYNPLSVLALIAIISMIIIDLIKLQIFLPRNKPQTYILQQQYLKAIE